MLLKSRFVKKFFTLPISIICLLLLHSCSRIYLGSDSQEIFDEFIQPDQLGDTVQLWEDGARTDDSKNQFEWWYFDAELDDGSLVVAYFYKVHFLKDQYFIGFNYTSPEKEDFFRLKYFKKNEVSFQSDSCSVTMNQNSFSGNLESYNITIDPNDFDGFGFDLNLQSLVSPYRPQDGVIRAGSDYFAWLAAVPNGNVNGTIIVDGQEKKIKGSGYHDHNWGNTPLQKLFKSWTWFRGKAGPYTVILAELNATKSRGGFDIPILFVADENKVLVDKFGNRELLTMKNDLIKDYYPSKNEPQFSNFLISSNNNVTVNISGNEIIDNIEIFKRLSLPAPLNIIKPAVNLAFKSSGIDPFYTRFASTFTLKIDENTEIEGTGVMEIMDLQ
tara:strand:- start:23028 stop:24185 length:1158 start_codon:yes stop_codon:yes gene_type:complete